MNLNHMNVPMALRNRCNNPQYQNGNQMPNQMPNQGLSPYYSNMNPMYQPYRMPMQQPCMVNPSIESYCKMIDILTRLKGEKVDILVVGREEPYKNLTINKIENGVLYAQSAKDACVIPVKTINTVFVSKDIVDKIETKYE